MFGLSKKEREARKERVARRNGFLDSVECGEYTLDFYYDEEDVEKCKVEIRCGVMMDVTLKASHEGYGFLMSCYQDNAKDAMEAYSGMLWQCSHLLAVDTYFPKRVIKSWMKWYRSFEKRAEAAAEAVTDIQNESDEVLMQEAVKFSEMDDEHKQKAIDEILDKLDKAIKSEPTVADDDDADTTDVVAGSENKNE